MTYEKTLRIDASIKPTSHIKTSLYVVLISIFILLAWLAKLLLWHYVAILMISAMVVCYLALSRPIVLHLSQPPLAQHIDQHWQVLVRTARDDALWQVHLLKVYHYHLCIHFEFMVVEPYQRTLSVTVFRDQVTVHEWRTLNVLANVMLTTSR